MCDKGPVNLQDSKFNDILKYKKSPEVHTQEKREENKKILDGHKVAACRLRIDSGDESVTLGSR